MGKWAGSSQETRPELLISGKLTPEPSLERAVPECNPSRAQLPVLLLAPTSVKLSFISLLLLNLGAQLYSQRENIVSRETLVVPGAEPGIRALHLLHPSVPLPCPAPSRSRTLHWHFPSHKINDPKSPILSLHSVQSLAPVQTPRELAAGSSLFHSFFNEVRWHFGGDLEAIWHPQ